MDNILEVKNLNKRLGGFCINDLSFGVQRGFVMGFIGPNGAGKTTTIKLILNIVKKDSGVINLFGQDNVMCEKEIKERIGVVLDKPFYSEVWTLLDIGKALSPFYKKWDHDKYKKLLSSFGLDAKKKVKTLSRGMKMKLMISVALSHGADLLILDEPTGGLDAVARDELMEILRDFISDGTKSILFSTHITSDLEKLADYITFVNNGKIIYSDTKDSLFERYVTIKGGLGILSPTQRNQIIGYREHGVGFDGLIDSSAIQSFPQSVLIEQTNLDDIVIRFNIQGGNVNE